MLSNKEMDEIVKACREWRKAKLQSELERLRKQQEVKKKPENHFNQEEHEKAGHSEPAGEENAD